MERRRFLRAVIRSERRERAVGRIRRGGEKLQLLSFFTLNLNKTPERVNERKHKVAIFY